MTHAVASSAAAPASPITIYVAREIVTMNPSNPTATHVAVRDGRILGAGSLDDLTPWGDYELDETFADHVLAPGFVEAHTHLFEGASWAFPFVGRFDRRGPDGALHPGSATVDELLDRLRALDSAMESSSDPLICWGFDPIYYDGIRISKLELDSVSTTRPIVLMHASLHLATANSAALAASEITASTETEGVARGADGEPNGELQEFPAMMLLRYFPMFLRAMSEPDAYWRFGRLAMRSGATTVTDLGSSVITNERALATASEIVNADGFPVRIVNYCIPGALGGTADYPAVASAFLTARAESTTDRLRFGGIKIVVDGSIQGYTAVLNWPGYVTGAPNGIWLVPPAQLREMVDTFHRSGINVHMHGNGDSAVDAIIDAVDAAVRGYAWLDHRHTVQHCQLTTSAQYRRMGALRMCANLFANHLWYWGDQHHALTVGAERANRLESAATAKREGVRFSIHSDAAVTPIGQLHTMWCIVNRVTPSGRVLGPAEKITAEEALKAVTLDAAYQMHMDAEIGSIEVGKRADFAVLSANPLTVDPMAIRDISVWGTVLGGVKQPADAA